MKIRSINFKRALEIATNLAIITVALVLVSQMVGSTFRSRRDQKGPAIGSRLSLSGVNWSENGTTLLLVLQKGCRYCEESAAFYRRLFNQRGERASPRILAIIPGQESETTRYLADQGVFVDDVHNSSLSDAGVLATPTLLLIDRLGQVKNVWVGKLNSNQESQVIAEVLGS